MNQKDYKSISKILAIKGNSESNSTINYRRFLVMKLADYFEKEYGLMGGKNTNTIIFDRQQFLKDCGVNG